jgi:aspartyl-tRNA(Asn)/glutamyl-tRNA(Gln) amidotransferase subunit C
MDLSTEKIKEIALLARVILTAEESKKYQSEVSEVIDYNAEQLKKIAPILPKVAKIDQLGQDDTARPSLPQDLALSNAPSQENGFFVVPKVLE